MGNIGIIGRARVGKDTAGKWLVDSRGYRRVGFADALKDMALRINPIVGTDTDVLVTEGDRLSDVVSFWGWEKAKEIPEVRRFLQELGAAVRAEDPEFWLRIALKLATAANKAGVPMVITDVRYPNEADSLRRAGFHLVHISRPDVPQLDHESEGALTEDDADFVIVNHGSVTSYVNKVESIWDQICTIESRKHFARL
ncbi:hypothetical protein [Streptomyces sp. NPDC006638]|uniref:deoxynucleotide monophosphate kinase family protein n=1 Tax=Streptomyces sp. NPDC006638 TaxID=3157183 RepID=UPI0033ACD2FF